MTLRPLLLTRRRRGAKADVSKGCVPGDAPLVHKPSVLEPKGVLVRKGRRGEGRKVPYLDQDTDFLSRPFSAPLRSPTSGRTSHGGPLVETPRPRLTDLG